MMFSLSSIVTLALQLSTVNAILDEELTPSEYEEFKKLGYKKALARTAEGPSFEERSQRYKNLIDGLLEKASPVNAKANYSDSGQAERDNARLLNEKWVNGRNSQSAVYRLQSLYADLVIEKEIEGKKATLKPLELLEYRSNDALVAGGNREAIVRKIIGLASGRYGYEKNPSFLANYLGLLANN